jgi:hypothetical protein
MEQNHFDHFRDKHARQWLEAHIANGNDPNVSPSSLSRTPKS